MSNRRTWDINDDDPFIQSPTSDDANDSCDGRGARKDPRSAQAVCSPCLQCLEDESNLRLSHFLSSPRIVESAAVSCCDETWPICKRCDSTGLRCVYHGVVRSMETQGEQGLHYQLDCRMRDLETTILFLRVLRHSSGDDAATALTRLRHGDNIGQLAASFRIETELTLG